MTDSLLAGRFELTNVTSLHPPLMSGYLDIFVTMGHNVRFTRVAVLASFVSFVVYLRSLGWLALMMANLRPLLLLVPSVWWVPVPMLCWCHVTVAALWG